MNFMIKYSLLLLCVCFLGGCASLIATDVESAPSSLIDFADNQTDVTMSGKAEIVKLNFNVAENRENELVFTISIDDFISSYNGFYWNDQGGLGYSPTSEPNGADACVYH